MTRASSGRDLKVFLVLFFLSLLIEIIQGALIQGRTFSIMDLLANATGLVIGWLISRWFKF